MNPASIGIPQGILDKWRGIVGLIAEAMKVPGKEQLPEDLRRSMEEMQGLLEEAERSQRAPSNILEDRKWAEEALQQQFMRSILLNQIARAIIAEQQDLEGIFRTVLRKLEDGLPVDFSGIRLFDPQADTLTVTAHGPKVQSFAAALDVPEGTVVPVEQTGLRACVQGEMVYFPDTALIDKPIPQKLMQVGLHSLVTTPLAVENRVFGILVAARHEVDSFSSMECEFLQRLSEHVALVIHHVQRHANLRNAYEELRQTQEATIQKERLHALKQMASGAVHDINNALSPIVGFTDLLLMHEASLSDRAKRYLEMIKTAGMDIALIMARMREFYRKREGSEPLSSVNLNQLAQQAIDLTRPRWKEIPQERGMVIEMKTDLHPGLPPVRGVESEIREAITNLILNAADAMPGGGKATIRTRVSVGSRGSPREGSPAQVILEVSDTGIGMDEEACRHCLEPFFSTKGTLGSGLGLAVVYGIMQRHEGKIEIESELGKGTTLRLIFPIREPTKASVSGGSEADAPLPSLRVLCVDDEPLLRELMKEMAESGGHQAKVADGGQGGLDAFRAANQEGEPFDVVITDLGMPHVDGRAVTRNVKRESPATFVIILTGWGTRLQAEGDEPMEVDTILSKPPRVREVWEALARVAQAKTDMAKQRWPPPGIKIDP